MTEHMSYVDRTRHEVGRVTQAYGIMDYVVVFANPAFTKFLYFVGITNVQPLAGEELFKTRPYPAPTEIPLTYGGQQFPIMPEDPSRLYLRSVNTYLGNLKESLEAASHPREIIERERDYLRQVFQCGQEAAGFLNRWYGIGWEREEGQEANEESAVPKHFIVRRLTSKEMYSRLNLPAEDIHELGKMFPLTKTRPRKNSALEK